MKTISPTMRHRLNVQGMACVSDSTMAEVTPFHRMAFFLCGLIVATATVLTSHTILFALVPIAVLAVIFPVHPFDLIYNFGIRHIRGTGPLPKRQPPVRFACAIGGAWVLGMGFAFQSGANTLGYVLGGVLVVMSLLVSLADICIASMIYQALPFTKAKA